MIVVAVSSEFARGTNRHDRGNCAHAGRSGPLINRTVPLPPVFHLAGSNPRTRAIKKRPRVARPFHRADIEGSGSSRVSGGALAPAQRGKPAEPREHQPAGRRQRDG